MYDAAAVTLSESNRLMTFCRVSRAQKANTIQSPSGAVQLSAPSDSLPVRSTSDVGSRIVEDDGGRVLPALPGKRGLAVGSAGGATAGPRVITRAAVTATSRDARVLRTDA